MSVVRAYAWELRKLARQKRTYAGFARRRSTRSRS